MQTSEKKSLPKSWSYYRVLVLMLWLSGIQTLDASDLFYSRQPKHLQWNWKWIHSLLKLDIAKNIQLMENIEKTSAMNNFTKELPQNTTVVQTEHTGQYSKIPLTVPSVGSLVWYPLLAITLRHVWGMSGTTSGAMDSNLRCYMHLWPFFSSLKPEGRDTLMYVLFNLHASQLMKSSSALQWRWGEKQGGGEQGEGCWRAARPAASSRAPTSLLPVSSGWRSLLFHTPSSGPSKQSLWCFCSGNDFVVLIWLASE